MLGEYYDDDCTNTDDANDEQNACTVDSTTEDTHVEAPKLSKIVAPPPVAAQLPIVNSAPPVETFGALTLLHQSTGGGVHGGLRPPEAKVIPTNPKADVLYKPVLGPLRPHELHSGHAGMHQNHPSGHVEAFNVGHSAFDAQYLSYRTTGVAVDPSDWHAYSSRQQQLHTAATHPAAQAASTARLTASTVSLANTGTSYEQLKAATQGQHPAPLHSTAGDPTAPTAKRAKRSRNANWDPSDDTYKGPWAPFAIDEFTGGDTAESGQEPAVPSAAADDTKPTGDAATAAETTATAAAAAAETAAEGGDDGVTSIFHGKQEMDYQGRSWLTMPPSVKVIDPEEVEAQLPRKLLHTYVGHTMGVHAIRFFPTSGHLLLSGSMDSSIKIWDLYNQRKCLRTYTGHSQAVRDIQFTNDGKRFYSCSYDKNINLWDTEYGKIIGKFTNGKIPYCVSVHPETGKQDDFIIGASNKRAVEFDAGSGKIVQEYAEHLGAVNTVTFCDDARKLVTTSDDKKVFIWEHGIPVVVKHISEPHMHAMPAVRKHPSNKYLACQSMDNKIVVYEAAGRFRFQGRKMFKGHLNAGYAIMPGFSPDGRFIMSGDAGGKLWFWDWKNLKNYRTIQAHSGVCICADWHPFMKSRVATCGWDGVIKLWD